jgi:hypothetical protein
MGMVLSGVAVRAGGRPGEEASGSRLYLLRRHVGGDDHRDRRAARPTLRASGAPLADIVDRARAALDLAADPAVADHLAVADDHGATF